MPNLKRKQIESFVDACSLASVEKLNPPRPTKRLTEWRTHERTDIVAFLGAKGQGRAMLEQWLVQGIAIEQRVDVLVLAQALRHATAHGALSPTKVGQWGLRKALDRLVAEVGLVGASAIERLAPAPATK